MAGADPFREVSPGEPLRIPAEAWNASMAAARAHAQPAPGAHSVEPSASVRVPAIVLVRNDSGADVGRFGVLAIGAPVIGPADNLAEFQTRPAFSGSAPSGAADEPVAVLLEPAAEGGFAAAVAVGPTLVKIDVSGGEYDHARPAAGDTAKLETCEHATGIAVLWLQGGAESVRWAWVELNRPFCHVPAGGTAGQVLGKNTGADYDLIWKDVEEYASHRLLDGTVHHDTIYSEPDLLDVVLRGDDAGQKYWAGGTLETPWLEVNDVNRVLKHGGPDDVLYDNLLFESTDDWIGVTPTGGNTGGLEWDQYGHVMESSPSNISFDHADPQLTTRTITIEGDEGLTGSGTVNADAKGHVGDADKSITLTHDSPGAVYLVEQDVLGDKADNWLYVEDPQVGEGLTFDNKGHYTGLNNRLRRIGHNVPQATDITITVEGGDGLTGSDTIGVDATGHVNEEYNKTITLDVENPMPTPPATGDYVLTSQDGVLSWVELSEFSCP